jgi:hypothetical protein
LLFTKLAATLTNTAALTRSEGRSLSSCTGTCRPVEATALLALWRRHHSCWIEASDSGAQIERVAVNENRRRFAGHYASSQFTWQGMANNNARIEGSLNVIIKAINSLTLASWRYVVGRMSVRVVRRWRTRRTDCGRVGGTDSTRQSLLQGQVPFASIGRTLYFGFAYCDSVVQSIASASGRARRPTIVATAMVRFHDDFARLPHSHLTAPHSHLTAPHKAK